MGTVEIGGAHARLIASSIESACGMLAFLGYGSLPFSRPSRIFSGINRSVFAIYILHMPVQQAMAMLLVQTNLSAWLTFALHLGGTLAICALIYAMVLRWAGWLHPLFGIAPLKPESSRDTGATEAKSIRRGEAATAGRFAVLYIASPVIALVTMHVFVSLAISSLGR